MLLINQTLESVKKRIIYNSKIMKLMNLPIIEKNDTDIIINQKINQVINKVITKTAQNPRALGEKTKPIIINGIKYDNYEEIRMTISIIQSALTGNEVFGNPRIEINIYYDNNNPDIALKILDLLSDEFSGKDLDVIWEDDNRKYVTKRELTCEGNTSQIPNINSYEKIGIRFSFYVTSYVPYH